MATMGTCAIVVVREEADPSGETNFTYAGADNLNRLCQVPHAIRTSLICGLTCFTDSFVQFCIKNQLWLDFQGRANTIPILY
jgi:hypothetical protein